MENENEPIKQKSLEEHIDGVKREWSSRIKKLNESFSNIKDLRDIMPELYTQRQIALEYCNTLLNKVSDVNSKYKHQYAEKYKYYRTQSNIMFKSDSAINSQIESDLREMIYKMNLMNDFIVYIRETIKTIDDMIYAIPNRIRLEELILGIDNSKLMK